MDDSSSDDRLAPVEALERYGRRSAKGQLTRVHATDAPHAQVSGMKSGLLKPIGVTPAQGGVDPAVGHAGTAVGKLTPLTDEASPLIQLIHQRFNEFQRSA